MGGSKLLKEVTMIVRSANERTEQLCKKLILDQGISPDNVFIVREVPFSAAMEESFKIGINKGLKWTFCIDADVLLRPNSIQEMLKLGKDQKENVCEIQGLVVDKFFGGPREAGNHLYRTSLLNKAIEKIPREGAEIRPETYTLNQMKSDGYPWKKIPYVVGLHDYEQYYQDIYRKCFTQGVKHVNFLQLFVTLWRENLEKDQDFEVALKSLADSIAYSKRIFIDKELSVFKEGYECLNIDEKEDIKISRINLEDVELIIDSKQYPDIYNKFFPTARGLISKRELFRKKLVNRFRNNSLPNFLQLSLKRLLRYLE